MSSRREEKERRREERQAAEEAFARSEARRRMIGIAVAAVLVVAAVAAVVVVVSSGGGSEPVRSSTTPKVPIPAQRTTDLRAAARAAGCQLRSFTPGPRDREHVTTKVQYKQNPPVFGPHSPTAASDGSYIGRPIPPTEALVHSLEHARIIFWYRPGLPERRLGQLEALLAEPFRGFPAGYKQIIVEHPQLPGEIAASSWGQQIVCPRFTDATFDALRAFRSNYVDKAPELNIPYPA